MERRRHPYYARRTAAFSFGLFAAALVCLALGQVVRWTMFRDLETVLNVAFALCFITAMVQWFATGETTVCPECGRRLKADRRPSPADPLIFSCSHCQLEWNVDAADEEAEDEPSRDR